MIPAIAVLSPNNSRPPDLLLPESTLPAPSAQKSSHGNNKRETEAVEKEKTCKIAKLSEPAGQRYEKENVDPRRLAATVKNIY